MVIASQVTRTGASLPASDGSLAEWQLATGTEDKNHECRKKQILSRERGERWGIQAATLIVKAPKRYDTITRMHISFDRLAESPNGQFQLRRIFMLCPKGTGALSDVIMWMLPGS